MHSEVAGKIEDKKGGWSPYDNHGGTSVGIVGKDFVAIGTDTRLSSNYSISCRHKSRVFQMTSKAMIVATGFDGDIDAFVTRIRQILVRYQQEHFKEMSTESLALCVSNILYSKRFFPYYINILVGGIGLKDEGLLYGYDPVGTLECLNYDAHGTGSPMAMPILDNHFGSMHHNTTPFPHPEVDDAVNLIRDIMASVSERDIYTGDCLQVAVMKSDGNLTITEYELPAH
ncbi:Family T1, proteasome beta subunit, threonine peptidase [Tritrichomonas foetus]|uniref:Proteasome subunit beta n=2 Tax=Tritrichomonas foetus TaxID=1144522 RepID=A0A1J4K9F8_9EUKA|nr:Family T1, proteasome beta subunit, threonine peptidase [Tritrichomonas foetus]|eukprot:OHT07578.1 Family T1, proteasome beta subunit, threonine peptidase [Tritrichomonas foetus]